MGKVRVNVTQLPSSDPRYQKWRKSLKGRVSWAKGKTKENDIRIKRRSVLMKKRGIDNFSVWRKEQIRSGKIKSIYPRLKHSTELAYLYGFILGDGHIEKHPRTEKLVITLNTKYPILIKNVERVMFTVFGKMPKVSLDNSSECCRVYIYEKYLSRRLHIKTGNKGQLLHIVPSWINRSKKFTLSFVKGLFEAEGSVSVHLPTYTYNMSFANKNRSLLDIVENILLSLGLHPEKREVVVRLRRKNEVEYFRKLINFRE
ncbi:MAG: hypothetical protein E6R05_02055 [Candidatus Moraniibacteriota bacterium]|nr:MAG: hypothetical protein E6R05_02055 [Candidatus Moranbacteria bacterium]